MKSILATVGLASTLAFAGCALESEEAMTAQTEAELRWAVVNEWCTADGQSCRTVCDEDDCFVRCTGDGEQTYLTPAGVCQAAL